MNKTSYSYCHELLGLKIKKSKALTNLVMALASNEMVQSVTELSLSPLYHYQYSSLSDTIDSLADTESEYLSLLSLVQGFVWSYYESISSAPLLLQTDVTPLVKRHSPTLLERGYIPVSNVGVKAKKPLDIGYPLSCINVGASAGGWSLPLDMRRVGITETPADVALAQLQHLKDHPKLGIGTHRVINTLDSAYSSASFLSRAYRFSEMVQVVRLRHGRTVWSSYESALAAGEICLSELPTTRGRGRSYGEAYSLIEQSQWKRYKKHPQTGQPYEKYHRSIYEKAPDDQTIIKTQTRKGRAIAIHLYRWNDCLLRTKRGFKMRDKPFDLLGCKVLDAQTQKRVFDLDMFLAIWGKKRRTLSTTQAYEAYRRRSHIEAYFRFGKQRLLLEQFQTPDRQHLDNWFICQILATWLLYTLRKEAQFIPRKWEAYLPQFRAKNTQQLQDSPQQESPQQVEKALSMPQTQRAALKRLLTFDPKPFKPQKSNKGRPRRKGEKQTPRKRYPVVKKKTKWYAHQYGYS